MCTVSTVPSGTIATVLWAPYNQCLLNTINAIQLLLIPRPISTNTMVLCVQVPIYIQWLLVPLYVGHLYPLTLSISVTPLYVRYNLIAGPSIIKWFLTSSTNMDQIGMMGYAKQGQSTKGIHLRLYARSFIIEVCWGRRDQTFCLDKLLVFLYLLRIVAQ